MADKLKVLLINDEGEKIAAFKPLLDIDIVTEPEQAQELLLKSQSAEKAYDIVLCDVNFEKSTTVRQFVRTDSQYADIVPLGPILALPFLSSRSTVFVPYSNFWEQLHRDPNIMLLAALGMIEARNFQEVVDLRTIAERLSHHKKDESQGAWSEVGLALTNGLRLFRKQLFADEGLLLNVGRLAQRVEALWVHGTWPPDDFQTALHEIQSRAVRAADAPPVHTLLRDETGTLALEVGKVRRMRKIALSSLYADYFLSALYSEDVTGTIAGEEIWRHAFQVMSDDFDQVKSQPMDMIVKEVAETLRLTDQTAAGWQRDNTLANVLKSRQATRDRLFPGVEDGYFVRYCVLAAWTAAWYSCMNDGVARTEIKPAVKRLLGLTPAEGNERNHGTTLYRRLFLQENPDAPRRDKNNDVTWAKPFRKSKIGIERWSLDTDEPSDLSAYDRNICEAFAALSEAEGGLDWTIGADGDQAPNWMVTFA